MNPKTDHSFSLQVLFSNAVSNPVPVPQAAAARSDIIAGQEFLSLFITENPFRPSSILTTTQNAVETTIQEDDPPTVLPDDDGENLILIETTREVPESTPRLVTTTTEVVSPRTSKKTVVVRKLINISASNSRNKKISPEWKIASTTTIGPIIDSDTNLIESSQKVNLLNSNRRSHLFIDEVEEPTAASSKDLINSESMNVPSIIVPSPRQSASSPSSSSSVPPSSYGASSGFPFTLHQDKKAQQERREQLQQQQEQQQLQDRVQSQSRSRTQRKQDDTSVPFQTIIFNQNSNVPRSISYASLTQKIDNRSSATKLNWNFPRSNQTSSAATFDESALPKVYSEPAKVYGEPAKVYGVPAKVYGQPAKVYSEPAKVYGEPSKIYSVPAKVYGIPPTPYTPFVSSPAISTTTPLTTTVMMTSPALPETPSSGLYQLNRKVIFNLDKLPYDLLNAPDKNLNLGLNNQPTHPPHQRQEPQKPSHSSDNSDNRNSNNKQMDDIFYKTEENQNGGGVLSEQNGGQQTEEEKNAEDAKKVGYVVEGRNYRKYRVEEKTPDGFIVGEYGVVTHNDGNLRGVRYTADSNINPRLIYDALLKFLSL